MKFGGTSVQDAAAMRNVIAIVGRRKENVLVVSSACAGVTNLLLDAAQKAGARDEKAARAVIRQIQKQHIAIANDLLGGADTLPTVVASIEESCGELLSLSHG